MQSHVRARLRKHANGDQPTIAARDVIAEFRSRPRELSLAVARRVASVMADRFKQNDILTYASAIARQLLIAVVPLVLLFFLLIGAFGEESTWRTELAPHLADRVSKPTFQAVNETANGLISSTHLHWLALAVLIVIWEASGAVRACMGGLNRIYEHEETRSTVRRYLVSVALAIPLILLVLASIVLTLRGSGLVDLGPAQPLWSFARWVAVFVMLWAVVALLIRYAPNGHRPREWITIGGLVVIVSWIAASIVFGWWVLHIADYKSPFGTMIAILTLVGYLYASSIVFLVGAQIDELLIEQTRDGERGPLDGVL